MSSTPSNAVIAASISIGGFALMLLSEWRAKMNAKTLCNVSYEVENKHIEFLEQMVKTYKLPNLEKAVRICIRFAQDKTTSQEELFVKKRCNTCGGKKNKKSLTVQVYGNQKDFVLEMKNKYNIKSLDKSMRCILEYIQIDGNKDDVFGTVRRYEN